jgi:putative transposase
LQIPACGVRELRGRAEYCKFRLAGISRERLAYLVMARKLRIEFPGAVYHVINRGNYRTDVFRSAGEAKSFLMALEEGVGRYGWRLHAFAVMRNHYHLALETPEPNLVGGMHWLQSTFATRFNRFRNERGHLFQGRYQALLVEDFAALSRVVDYIHLNPVRAGIVPPERAAEFRWSSLPALVRGPRFPGLVAEAWLGALGLSDDPEGWIDYLERLRRLAGDTEEQARMGFDSMSRGWAIGTAGWRKAVAKDLASMALTPGLSAAEVREIREAKWEAALSGLLAAAGRSEPTVGAGRKAEPWKVELALALRDRYGASTRWIAEKLAMGSPDSVRSVLSARRRQP